MWPRCLTCGYLFEREQGYFIGAIYVNVIATEIAIIAAYLVLLLFMTPSSEAMIVPLLVIAVLFPLAFFHHSRSLWLGIDYLLGAPRTSRHWQAHSDTEQW